jgi:class 3 adenylate cyclase/tetratricopeptide (TPR) repeat protein
MLCPNCQTINPPSARFCMECGTHLLICPNCRTANLPVAKFCIECGQELFLAARSGSQGTVPLPEFTPQDMPQFHESAPVQNGRVTAQLTAPEERRVVTIMFADITGSTPLADRLDPEDMRAILTGYFNLMTEQIRRHGGTVEKYIGDAVMAVFGSPVAHEDDPDRAIRAALDMQTALNNFNITRQRRESEAAHLQMRIGINTGDVAAPGAPFNRQDFLITGDAVNVAARLQQVATPDTILVGERTYLATREVFEFHSLAPLQVKGKKLPLNAWVIQGFRSRDLSILQHPRGIEGLQAPLVGRMLELTLMHATYARVRDARHTHLITLLGSSGVGKSRLIREFIEREGESARSTTTSDDLPMEPRVLQGHCPPYGEGITYWPLVEILRSLIQVRDGESGETLEQRFVLFVSETLRKARRSEDIEQVVSVLLHSIGQGLRGDKDYSERREIQRSTLNKDMDKGGPQGALQRACRILLEAIAQIQPLILVIDDLQWADEALLNLLEYLTGHITDFPLLFLCLARPDFLERKREWGGGRPNFTTIILDALTTDETTELITELLATRDLPDVLLYTIQRRAEGNPFFVEEIVRMLIDQGVLVHNDGTWRIGSQNEDAVSDLASPAAPPDDTLIDQHYVLPLPRVPDTIQGVLAARVDLLSGVDKQVLQCASIVGRTFGVSALLELTEDLKREVVLQTLEQLARLDFIEESEKQRRVPDEVEPAFSFKHILIRDVVYNTIPRHRRAQKHAQLALWLEQLAIENQEAFAELLAYHYQQALANWSTSRHVERNNAEEHEHSRARENLLSGLKRTELVERTIRYLTLAGDNAYHSYYTIRAIQAYTEALDLLQTDEVDPLTVATMHQKLGHAYIQRSNADDAWREYLLALSLMKNAPTVAMKDLLGLYINIAELPTRWLGWFNTWLDMEEVRGYINEGLKLVEGQPASAEQSAFLTFQAMWYIRQTKHASSPEQRNELTEQALQSGLEGLHIAEVVNHASSLWIALDSLGFIYSQVRRYNEAHETQHRRQTLQHLIHGREELYDLYISLGSAHKQISNYATAASWYGRAWRIAQTMESPSMLLTSMHLRLAVWYQWDRWNEACDVAKSILQTSDQYQQDLSSWQLRALEILAELTYRTGHVEQSAEYLRLYQRLSEQYTTHLPLLSAIYTAQENWAQALEETRKLIQSSEPFPYPDSIARLAELVVIAGEPVEEQQAICTRAVAMAEQTGIRKYFAVALRARGRMHLGQENWSDAERDYRAALEIFQELDLSWERGETLYCLGQFYQRSAVQSDIQETSEHGLAQLFFEQALGFFESLGAIHDAQRTRLALEQTHLTSV